MRHLWPLFAIAAACGGKPPPSAIAPDPGAVGDSSSVAGQRESADSVASTAPPPAKGNPRADLIPREVLFGNPEFTNVQLSPNGKMLAWIAPKDGVMNVFVAPVTRLADAKAVTSETVRPIRGFSWAHTNQHVVYQNDVGGDENFHVFRTDIADGKTLDLTPFKDTRADVAGLHEQHPKTLWVQMNDRDKTRMDFHKIDIVTGKRELVVQNDEGFIGFVTDNAMNARLAMKKASDGATEIHQRGADGTWTLWETIPFADADSTNVIGFVPGDKAIYVIETRGRDTAALMQVDLASKKSKLLAENAKADVQGFLVHPTKHHIQAAAFNYDRVSWTVIDKSIAKDLDAFAGLVPGGDWGVVSRTQDDKHWVVVAGNERKVGQYYLWDRAKRKSTFLFSSQPALEKQPLVAMHPVIIKSRDGLDLVSYLTLPTAADADGDGKPNAPVPLVLWIHGGPWARDDWGFDSVHQMLANRGYAVLSVNYRGSTGFGKRFMNAGNLEWGNKMHEDVLDALDWAVTAGVAPRDKVCIGGGSYGGYETLVGVTMTPDAFACGVDIVGIANLHTFIQAIPPYWKPFLATIYARIGNPETADGKQMLTDRSPLTHAGKIKRPLLIGQGANDPRVKQAESEQIVAAMKKHGLPVSYVLFPDEGHGFARPGNRIAFFAVMEAFLSAHLGGSYQPLTKDELSATTLQVKDGRPGIPGLP